MQTYDVKLECAIYNSYFCRRAADSLDIDVSQKSKHHLNIRADIEAPYNIGLILGASGSGKTTLAKKIFGEDCFTAALRHDIPIIEQFPESYDYEQRSALLHGVGLSQVPCWIRPAYTLSNGQKSRAEAALLMTNQSGFNVIDEWTSVVDRTAAKIMSHCIQKYARRIDKQIVLLSCHYDVLEWLNPDWVIDCNKQSYTNRRLLWQSYTRTERLHFSIRKSDRACWRYFSQYHYLTHNLGPSHYIFALFHQENQIGFIAYSNYTPYRKKQRLANKKMILHANRIVIHPDYAGLGLGILLTTETAKLLSHQYSIRCKFSSTPMYYAMKKSPSWKLIRVDRDLKNEKKDIIRQTGFRVKIKTYTFKFSQNE